MSAVERRPWPGDPRYLVGADGTIVGPSGRVLIPQAGNGRYRTLMTCTGGKRWWRPVHIMVCEAFHGPRPDGHEVAHLNGDRLDCRAVNLSWKTRPDNHADKHLHGTAQQGERANNHKLTDDQVREIRRRAADGERQIALARAHGVGRWTIRRVVERESWVHL